LLFVGKITRAETKMASITHELNQKLIDGRWSFNQLPVRYDSTSWNDVKVDCGLSNAQMSELKNMRCTIIGK
jgi:hypothetical protein